MRKYGTKAYSSGTKPDLDGLPAASPLVIAACLLLLGAAGFAASFLSFAKGRRRNNFTDSVRSCSSTSAESRAVSVGGIEAARESVPFRWDSCGGRGER